MPPFLIVYDGAQPIIDFMQIQIYQKSAEIEHCLHYSCKICMIEPLAAILNGVTDAFNALVKVLGI